MLNIQCSLALRYGEVQFFESIVSIEFARILYLRRFEFVGGVQNHTFLKII